MKKRKIGIIGVTGSVGSQTVDVLTKNPDMFETVFVTAHTDKDGLERAASITGAKLKILTGSGMQELLSVIDNEELDIAVVAASGTQVLLAAYALAAKGVHLALANKECLVAAGDLIVEKARQCGSVIIPVDSEHSALFQCMQGYNKHDISGLTLTASGGAFRDYPPEMMENVTVADALKHPNWVMGKKITIDSATMMNKGLELIEARVLFDVEPEMLHVVIHPESIVHSMVGFKDGSMLAQMGVPDMRTPIAYALGYPERIDSGVKPLDFATAMAITFYPPDMRKYPCLKLATGILHSKNISSAIAMNAANEVSVEGFLTDMLAYKDIYTTVAKTVDKICVHKAPENLDDVLYIDKLSRDYAAGLIRG